MQKWEPVSSESHVVSVPAFIVNHGVIDNKCCWPAARICVFFSVYVTIASPYHYKTA